MQLYKGKKKKNKITMTKSNLIMSWGGLCGCFKVITQDLVEESKGGIKVDREKKSESEKGLKG